MVGARLHFTVGFGFVGMRCEGLTELVSLQRRSIPWLSHLPPRGGVGRGDMDKGELALKASNLDVRKSCTYTTHSWSRSSNGFLIFILVDGCLFRTSPPFRFRFLRALLADTGIGGMHVGSSIPVIS